MQHDADQATKFLRLLRPVGWWVLTAIAVDKQGITTRSFAAGDELGVAGFLRNNGDRNVYYSLNPTTRELTQKADKTEIAAVEYLHVDIDPRTADASVTGPELVQYLSSERDRILDKCKVPPSPIPQPTACVFSGGGYQPLWRLAQPIPIVGDAAADRIASAEQAERYNIGLEWAFGGDHCFNVDRILRLPGTINYPDAKKRARGRIKQLAELIWFDPDGTLPIEAFTPANPVQSKSSSTSSIRGARPARPIVAADGNVRRYTIEELGELLPKLPTYAKVVIVQGFHPNDPGKHTGRSEWLFYVCCELLRAGAEDAVIYSVITDQDFGISASVLDKGATKDRYVNRQIERAKEEAINPLLRELNERHAVIENFGGRCRVVEEIQDPITGRSLLTVQSFDDFRNRYSNRRVDLGTDKHGNPIREPLGIWWLGQQARRQYRSIVFSPECDIPGAYNLWEGFAYEARPGDRDASFLQHIRANLCNNDEAIYQYVLGWMASAVQFPARPGKVAIVQRGLPGTGKSFFAKRFGALFGRHFLHVSNAAHLIGNFNAQLRDAVVVFADEAFFAGDKRHESVLKTMITEESMIVERKGIDAEAASNFVHLIMASNYKWVVPSGHFERRYLVLDVTADQMQNPSYFSVIATDLERDNGAGYSHLLYRLKTFDLTGFDVTAVPKTAALRDQKILSMDSTEEWLFRKLEDGILLPNHLGWNAPVLKDALLDDYLVYSQRVGTRRSTATALGHFLAETFGTKLRRFQAPVERYDEAGGGKRIELRHFYEFPPIDLARKMFEANGLGEYPWPNHELRDLTHREADAF